MFLCILFVFLLERLLTAGVITLLFALNVPEHFPCVCVCVFHSSVLAVLSVKIMYATRVHVLSGTPACLCLLYRLCPKELVHPDPVGVSGCGERPLACLFGGVFAGKVVTI